jgi:hypothetical protein
VIAVYRCFKSVTQNQDNQRTIRALIISAVAAGVTLSFLSRKELVAEWLKGKAPRRTLIPSVSDIGVVAFDSKITATCQLRRAAAPARNTQVNSKYYRSRSCVSLQQRTREAIFIACSELSAAVAGGPRRAIFKLPLGHRRLSVKGRA